MKWKGLIFVAFILSSIALGAFYPKVNVQEKESLILNAIVNYLDHLHFQPQNLDDSFSEKTFNSYLEMLDPGKRFFIQQEVDQLAIYKDQIDDQIRLRNFEFFDISVELIDASRKRAEGYFKEIIDSEFDFNSSGYIEMDSEKRAYAQNEAELKEYWKKLLQFDINSRLENKLSRQENYEKNKNDQAPEYESEDFDFEDDQAAEDDEEIVIKSREELTKEVIAAAKKSYKDWFERMAQDRRSDRFGNFMNAITHVYDPHSDYFSPKEKEDFDIRMGGKLEGIGARLQTEGDMTKVVSIIPGGPAWKGKELEVNDLIVAVQQENNESEDIKGMRLDDVVQKIRGKKGTTVILTVKKADGSTSDITIIRDEVNIDEGFARSLILDIPDVIDNVGYIKLPRFYSTFEGKDGNSCAIDVALELEKLNTANVNAVILDLRNNGGGSLGDVVDMTGLFIEEGPIVQVKPRKKEAYIYPDEDASVHYDGPLVVLVNSFSASASEILVAALQDYNRAVIVGSNSTFGKGTVQRFVDLDKAYRDQDALKPLGQLKITMQKFYRVNGGSTQLKGVVPDIVLPDNFAYIETGEKDYEYALGWSEIEPVEYSQNVYHVPFIDQLKNRSNTRVANKKDFQLILENADRLKTNREESSYPLGFDAYRAFNNARDEEAKKYDVLFENEIPNLMVKNLAADTSYINMDESRVARNDDWFENVKKDIYLEEAIYILKDMIDLHGSLVNVKEKN